MERGKLKLKIEAWKVYSPSCRDCAGCPVTLIGDGQQQGGVLTVNECSSTGSSRYQG